MYPIIYIDYEGDCYTFTYRRRGGVEGTLYISASIDNALESIGKVYALRARVQRLHRCYVQGKVGILCSGDVDKGYSESIRRTIDELLSQGKEVLVFCSRYFGGLSQDVIEYCIEHAVPYIECAIVDNANYLDTVDENTLYLLESIYKSNLETLYWYGIYSDIVSTFCLQGAVAEEIIIIISQYAPLLQGITSSVVDGILVEDKSYALSLLDVPLLQGKRILFRAFSGSYYDVRRAYSESQSRYKGKVSNIQVINIDHA